MIRGHGKGGIVSHLGPALMRTLIISAPSANSAHEGPYLTSRPPPIDFSQSVRISSGALLPSGSRFLSWIERAQARQP